MTEQPNLHCSKCNISFTPKLPQQMDHAKKELATHEQNCIGKKTLQSHNTASTTYKDGHAVTSTVILQ
ncbi:MAG: hypothetical protein WC365_08875 [Candidatus Babeliales bacterium]|jgi:hypothetical protein